MGRTTRDTGSGDFKQAPTGTFVARAFRIVDIGTQHGEWNGEPTERNQFILFWELPTETFEAEGQKRPFVVSKFYTNSLHEKATLRHDLESWRGKEFNPDELAGFDLMNILDQPCLLTIIESGGKSKVASVAGLPRGVECPPQVNETQFFFLDEFSEEEFNSLSDGLKKLIKKSDEYKALTGEVLIEDRDKDLPF